MEKVEKAQKQGIKKSPARTTGQSPVREEKLGIH